MLSWSESFEGDDEGEMMGETEIWVTLAELWSERLPERGASDLSASEVDSGAADSGTDPEAPAPDVSWFFSRTF